MVIREEYLEKLRLWKDHDVIKVVTGVRRCGKSTLFDEFIAELKLSGIDEKQIIQINFEEFENIDLLDSVKLHEYIMSKSLPNKKMYVFLDEVQNVNRFERCVASLYAKKNYDLYITGSNSNMFSGQLATLLTGRYITIDVLPLSFKEYMSVHNGSDVYNEFRTYMVAGGFPYIHASGMDENSRNTYYEGIYSTILVKDIEERIRRKGNDENIKITSDTMLLRLLTNYLASIISSPVSARGIANYLKNEGRSYSVSTIGQYLETLKDAYLFYPVEVIDVVGKRLLDANKKYYVVDTGLRQFMVPEKNRLDVGYVLENIVYLELIRRGYKVYTGREKSHEIDFIAKNKGLYTYYQVSAYINSEETFQREIRVLSEIADAYPKIILTLDQFAVGNYNGVEVKNIVDWLLDK